MKLNKILLNTIKFLLCATPLIMLYVGGNLGYPFISGKAYLLRAIIAIALIFYLFLAARDRNYLPNFKNPLVISLTILMTILTITAFTGIDWRRSLFGTLERSEGLFHLFYYYIFFLLMVSVFKKRRDWEITMGVYVLSVFAMTIYSWFNGFWARDLTDINNTIYGTAGHKVYYGVALLFAIFFSLYFLLLKKLKSQTATWQKLTYYTIIFFCLSAFLVSLIMSKARGSLLGLSAGIFLSAVIFLLLGYKKHKYYKIIVVAVMLFIIITVGIIFVFKDGPLLYDNGIVHRYLGFSPSVDKTLYDQTLQTRFWTWGSAWEGIKERPVLGWGLDNFSFVFDKYFDVRHYVGPGSETWFDHPHNIFIEYWIIGGIGGIIAYIAVFISALYLLIKKIYFKKIYFVIWAIGFLSAYLIQNLFSFDMIYSYLGFFILLGSIYFFSQDKRIGIKKGIKKSAERVTQY